MLFHSFQGSGKKPASSGLARDCHRRVACRWPSGLTVRRILVGDANKRGGRGAPDSNSPQYASPQYSSPQYARLACILFCLMCVSFVFLTSSGTIFWLPGLAGAVFQQSSAIRLRIPCNCRMHARRSGQNPVKNANCTLLGAEKAGVKLAQEPGSRAKPAARPKNRDLTPRSNSSAPN